MNNFRMKLYQFMQGRYGLDEFGQFLLIFGFVFVFGSRIAQMRILYLVGLALLVYAYIRIVSKNIFKRQQENSKFRVIKGKITRTGSAGPAKNRQRGQAVGTQQHDTENYNFYKCRNCGQIVRVPKGKGSVRITCPGCGNSFVDRT